MKYEIYRQLTLRGRRWAWRLKARNGEIIAHGESYHNKADMLDAIDLVRGSAHIPIVEKQ